MTFLKAAGLVTSNSRGAHYSDDEVLGLSELLASDAQEPDLDDREDAFADGQHLLRATSKACDDQTYVHTETSDCHVDGVEHATHSYQRSRCRCPTRPETIVPCPLGSKSVALTAHSVGP